MIYHKMQCNSCSILIGPGSEDISNALAITRKVESAISNCFIDIYRKKHASYAFRLLDVHHDAEYEKFLVRSRYPKEQEDFIWIKRLIEQNQSIQISIISEINELKKCIDSLENHITDAYVSESLQNKIDEIESRIESIPKLFDQLATGRK